MNQFIVQVDFARKVTILSILDGITQEKLSSVEIDPRVPEPSVFHRRNQICEYLSEIADKVWTKTYDWRS